VGNSIWVIPELNGSELCEVSYEILAEARRIGTQLKYEVSAVLIGWNTGNLAEELIHWGADKVYIVEHELLTRYTTDGYVHVLSGLIEQYAPSLVIIGGTANGCDYSPRLAARLRAGLVTDCTLLKVSREGTLELTQPTYEDRVYRILGQSSTKTQIVAMRPGVVGKDKPNMARRGDVVNITPNITKENIRTNVLEQTQADPNTLPVQEADVIVIGGRGVQPDKWHLIEELAEVLRGCVGGTRMALDQGSIKRDRMIGQTGKTISPKLCIEVGISGAIKHTAGIKNPKLVLAINNDKYTLDFKIANVGVSADLNDFLPALITRLKEVLADRSTSRKYIK
jgi:caffeyl-CoA reductase-Etf complex subunit CarE